MESSELHATPSVVHLPAGRPKEGRPPRQLHITRDAVSVSCGRVNMPGPSLATSHTLPIGTSTSPLPLGAADGPSIDTLKVGREKGNVCFLLPSLLHFSFTYPTLL